MFDKEYSFKGKHAEMVLKLTAPFNKQNATLFARNLDVYLLAPIIGFLYSRTAEIDRGNTTTKIFLDQISKSQIRLWFNYRLIMLLDVEYEPDTQNRMDKAFRYYGTKKANEDESLYEKYVLGGVEILFEKLIEPAKKEEDYFLKLYELIEEANDRYNKNINTESVLDLCKLARE